MPSSISLPATDSFPAARTDSIEWPGLREAGVRLSLRREDLLFPLLSGNKLRKLQYNLKKARAAGLDTLLTFGGAYSNHIHAIAAAGQLFGFRTIGLIRGDELSKAPLNPTLEDARRYGMELEFVSRETYRKRTDPAYHTQLREAYGPLALIPEGGTNALAIRGCAEILQEEDRQYDLICCPVGTGGTLAGLVTSGIGRVWGYAALKGIDAYAGLSEIKGDSAWELRDEFHFGGYARTSPELLHFICDFYERTGVILDAVYTGKMVYGVLEDIKRGRIPSGSHVLAIHTGGVQGNRGMNEKLRKKGLPLLPV